jgi:hypothetical protein
MINRPKKNIIFTCSTYFAKPKKLEQFITALNSIPEKHLIDKFVVVNEYDPNDKTDYTKILHNKFPFVEFIQKHKNDAGQARTLNIILEKIKPYKFWIHWEESWKATRPFITESLQIMNRDITLTQLQLTHDWKDIDPERIKVKQGYSIITLHPMFNKLDHDPMFYDELVRIHGIDVVWPLYSLRPSFNRIDHYKHIAKFPEDPSLWPVRFEYEYGLRWIRAGSVKAVIDPHAAIRQKNHKSTYA